MEKRGKNSQKSEETSRNKKIAALTIVRDKYEEEVRKLRKEKERETTEKYEESERK